MEGKHIETEDNYLTFTLFRNILFTTLLGFIQVSTIKALYLQNGD